MKNLKQELELDEHKIEIEDLFKRYQVDVSRGLTNDQVHEKRQMYGENCLTPPKVIPEWIKFCKQLFGGFSLLLWLGSLLCFVAYIIDYSQDPKDASKDNLFLGFILAGVVMLSGFFSYWQVRKLIVIKKIRRLFC